MKIVALPALDDNYIWMLHDGTQAIVVDPGENQPVLAALQENGLELAGILVTHHHADHIGGVAGLRELSGAAVFGPAHENIPRPFTPLDGDSALTLLGVRWLVLDVPGHTSGHIAFFAQPPGLPPLLFCGDTLFHGGCGRVFEGTHAQMLASLDRLAALPDNTLVCCAHEYTVSNLRFAHAVEPENERITRHLERCAALREQRRCTLPSDMATERAINPFLRVDQPAVIRSARAHDPHTDPSERLAVFTTLRNWKNNFR